MAEVVKSLVSDLESLSSVVDKLSQRMSKAVPGFDNMAAAERKALEATLKYNKKVKEAADAQKRGEKAFKKYEASLSKLESQMHKAVGGLQAYKKAQGDVDSMVRKGISFEKDMSAARNKSALAVLQYNKALAGLKGESKKGTEALAKYKKELDSKREAMDSAIKSYGIYKKASDDLSSAVKKSTGGFKQYKQKLKDGVGGLKKFGTSVLGVTSALGVGAVSFKSIIDAASEYNQTITDLGSALAVGGRSLESWNSVIAKVRETTVLGQTSFAKFAASMTKGVIGRPPDVEEWVKFGETLHRQVGGGLENLQQASKKLLNIQNKFPSVFEQIKQGLELRQKVDLGKATAEEEKLLATMESGIQLQLQRIGLSSTEAREVSGYLSQKDAATRKAIETEMAMVKTQEALSIAVTELSKAAMPMLKMLADGLTKILNVATAIPKTLLTIGKGMLALKIGKPIIRGMVGGFLDLNKHMKKSEGVMGKVAQATWKTSSGMTKAGASLGALGALFAGFEVGRFLDDMLGISAAIGEIAGQRTKNNLLKEEDEDVKNRLDNMKKNFSDKSKDIPKMWDKILEAGGSERETFAQTVTLEKVLKGEYTLDQVLGKNKDTMEDTNSESAKAVDLIKQQSDNASLLQQAFNKAKTEQEISLTLLDQMVKPLEKQAQLAEQFGVVNKEALNALITQMQIGSADADKLLDVAIKKASSGVNVSFNMSGDVLDQASALQEILTAELRVSKEESRRVKINNELRQLSDAIATSTEKRLDIVNQIFETEEAHMRQQEQQSTKYERRLNTQRKLMESAQFGLGASVEMMQKQVDLAHQFMNEYKDTDANIAKRLVKETSITAEQIEQVKTAKSGVEAQKMSESFLTLSATEQSALTKYAAEHQSIVEKTMQQQQKIYDITKEVREGYLDAIREMSVGAGEFGKIIGNQKEGVTQLMNLTKGVTGMDKLNTMALGGMQETSVTEQGVGKKVAYKFTAQGVQKGISSEEEKTRLNRLHKYGEETNSTVGTAANATDSQKAALRDAELIANKTEGAIEKGFKKSTNDLMQGMIGNGKTRLPGQNPNAKGNPGQNAVNLGKGVLAKSTGGVSDPTGGWTLNGEKMSVPVEEVYNLTVKYQEELKAKLANSKKGSKEEKDITRELVKNKKVTEDLNVIASQHKDLAAKNKAKIIAEEKRKFAEATPDIIKSMGISKAQLAKTGYKNQTSALKYLLSGGGSGNDLLTKKQRTQLAGFEGNARMSAAGFKVPSDTSVTPTSTVGKEGRMASRFISGGNMNSFAGGPNGIGRMGGGISNSFAGGSTGIGKMGGMASFSHNGKGSILERNARNKALREEKAQEKAQERANRRARKGSSGKSGLGSSNQNKAFTSYTQMIAQTQDFSEMTQEEITQYKKERAAVAKGAGGVGPDSFGSQTSVSAENKNYASAQARAIFERMRGGYGGVEQAGESGSTAGEGTTLEDVNNSIGKLNASIESLKTDGIKIHE